MNWFVSKLLQNRMVLKLNIGFTIVKMYRKGKLGLSSDFNESICFKVITKQDGIEAQHWVHYSKEVQKRQIRLLELFKHVLSSMTLFF